MRDNKYLIPANTKRGELIFGYFQPVDLIIFLTGVGITLLIFVIMSLSNISTNTVITLLTLMPGLLATLLVVPIANYHNVRTAIGELFAFYTNRQKYVWRGWCTSYEFKNK